MTAAVMWLRSAFDPGAGLLPTVMQVVALVLLGAAVHVSVQTALWKLQGSADSAEAKVLGRCLGMWARLRKR
jgi:hypothetical protein